MLRKLNARVDIVPAPSYSDLYVDPLDIRAVQDYDGHSCITVVMSSVVTPQFFFVKETPQEIIDMIEKEDVLQTWGHIPAFEFTPTHCPNCGSVNVRQIFKLKDNNIECSCVACSYTWTAEPVKIGAD